MQRNQNFLFFIKLSKHKPYSITFNFTNMNKIFYFILAITLFLASCKKKSDTFGTGDVAAAVLKSVSQVPNGIITNYSYDSQGRLVQQSNSNLSGTNIVYSGDTVTETMINDSGSVYAINTVFLNASGIATSSFLRDTSGSILSYSQFFYDSSDFRIQQRTYAPSGTQTAYQEWNISYNNVYYYTSTDSLIFQNNAEIGYSYSYDHKNTIGNYNTGLQYYGKSSENVETILSKSSSATGNVRYTFQYTFDSSGRIASKTAYNHLNELVYTNTYTYY